MCTAVDVQVSLLHEALVAVGTITNPLLLGLVVGRYSGRCMARAGWAGRTGRAIGLGSGCWGRALSNLRILFVLLLNSLHEFVDVCLKVDSVGRVNGLVESDRFGVGVWVGGSRGDRGDRLASGGRRRMREVVNVLGIAAEHGDAVVVTLGQRTFLVFGPEWRANGRSWRRALIWNVGECIVLLVVRSRHGLHGSSSVGRSYHILGSWSHLSLLNLRWWWLRVPGVVWHKRRSVHHVEVVCHLLWPASPVGVSWLLSSESQFDGCAVKLILPVNSKTNLHGGVKVD